MDKTTQIFVRRVSDEFDITESIRRIKDNIDVMKSLVWLFNDESTDMNSTEETLFDLLRKRIDEVTEIINKIDGGKQFLV